MNWRVGNSIISICNKDQRGLQINFMPVKSGKRSGFVFDSYLKDNAFAATRRDAKL